MDNIKWLIQEQTLKDIADGIRFTEGSELAVSVEDYAKRIRELELAVTEYLTLDYLVQNEHAFISNFIIDPYEVNALESLLTKYKNEMEVIK